MAEQLALGQGLGQGRAVDLDQRLVAAPRQAMQTTGEQLLADPGLAQQQYRQLGVGQYFNLAEQLLQHGAVA
ncbi:hypothetical protein D3C81_1976680 [compost metagenome]